MRTDALIQAIERSLFVYPEVPGLVSEIGVRGVIGRESSVSHPIANLIGCADLTEAGADATIAAIRDRFAASGKSFGWVTSPESRPADLPQRLTAAGLVKADELAGMVLTNLESPIRANPDVEVRAANVEEQRAAVAMTAEAYDLPVDVAEWFVDVVIGSAGRINSTVYHAYVPESPGPVAFGNLVFIPDTSIVLLGGAATLTPFRGRGVYTTLVARRLADARAGGAEAVVIQAVRGTSAPVCANLGFKEMLPLELYAWVPPGVEMDLHA
ncbi:MAG TPA: hypothetical protein VJP81_07275 [Candidatus Dormibacteraeota bacterium]|nr:hypothetical protein [Candidatus Dormibacteraeota bacterium]